MAEKCARAHARLIHGHVPLPRMTMTTLQTLLVYDYIGPERHHRHAVNRAIQDIREDVIRVMTLIDLQRTQQFLELLHVAQQRVPAAPAPAQPQQPAAAPAAAQPQHPPVRNADDDVVILEVIPPPAPIQPLRRRARANYFDDVVELVPGCVCRCSHS